MAIWQSNLTRATGSGQAAGSWRGKLDWYRLRWMAVVVAIIAALALGGKPAYRWFRNRQTDHNLETAKAAARTEDWGAARDLARSVLIARPGDFEAYRVWFQAMAKMGEPRTYMVATSLLTDPRASREDRVEALRVMALQAPQAVAFAAFASLPKAMQADTAVRVAIVPLLLQRGEFGMVEKMLREAPDLATNPAARFELLRVLCAKPTAARVAEARQIFDQLLGEGASGPALQSLVILGGTTGGLAPGEPFSKLVEWVEVQPTATTRHRLLAQDPLIAAAPNSADMLFQKSVDRFLKTDAGALGDWLVGHGKTSLAAQVLTDPAKTDPAAFFSRIRALLREKRTAEVAAAFQDPPQAADMVDLELAKAAAARIEGNATAESNAWNQALANAAFDQSRNRFLEIRSLAAAVNATGATIDSLVAAVRVGWGQLPLYQDLLPVFSVLVRQGRSEDLLAMYRVLSRLEPGNAELANNYIYLSLLHDVTPPATAIKELQELIAAHPASTEYLSALAMAHLMAGNPAAVLQLLPQLEQCRRISPAMRRALHGSALLLGGDSAQGLPLLQGINWKDFQPCETLAFRRMLTSLQLKELPLPELEVAVPTADPDAVPAWRKAVERLEKQRVNDVLPPLPPPRIPGSEPEP